MQYGNHRSHRAQYLPMVRQGISQRLPKPGIQLALELGVLDAVFPNGLLKAVKQFAFFRRDNLTPRAFPSPKRTGRVVMMAGLGRMDSRIIVKKLPLNTKSPVMKP